MKRNQTEFLKICLADALVKLMADKPYEDISVNAICEMQTSGVLPSTAISITKAAKRICSFSKLNTSGCGMLITMTEILKKTRAA